MSSDRGAGGGLPRPRVGVLLGLIPQAGVGRRDLSWFEDGRGRVRHIDVGYSLPDGPGEGRRLDCQIRTRLIADPTELQPWALQHADDFTHHDLPGVARWAAIRILIDGRQVPAVQTVVNGWEVIALELDGRFVSIVTSVFDAEHLTAEYETERPWPDDAPDVFDPEHLPIRERRKHPRRLHYLPHPK